MAGHKFSGYIRLVWQSLFAAFARLFRRIFPLLWKNNTSPGPQPPAVSDADHTEAETQDSSTTTAGPASNVTSESDHPPDLEKGQQQTEDEVMAASKKRGNKRSGVKPENSTQPATATGAIMTGQRDKENMGPGKQIGQSAAASTATETQKTPLGTSRGIGKIDTKGTSQQPDAQRPTSAGSKSSGKSRGRPSPTATQFDDTIKTEGPAPAREAPTVVCSQTPAITSTVPAEGKSEVQGTGSHSQTGTQNPDLAPKPATTKRADDELVHIQAQQAVVAIDQLALDDNTPGPEKALTKDTAAVEAAGVPVVVVNPISGQPPITLKPLAPLVTPPSHVLPGLIEPDTEEGKRERAVHLDFMREALNMGDAALSINETPVGCVLVYKNRIIAKGMNATNVTRNGTRHAEFMALSALLSRQPDVDVKDVADHDEALWGDVDPSDGHIFPYGQKLHPSPKVNRAIISECILYVTVEPCVMCASLLRQLKIKHVYFGAVNDKFGGTGGVFRIHMNSKPVAKPTDDRPYQNGYGPQDVERIQRGRIPLLPREEDEGDGGNVEPGYPAEGGFLRDEAVSLLRRFYVQENGRAPQPRKKEGRAARLFAMENAAANGGILIDQDGNVLPPESPTDGEMSSINGDTHHAAAT